MSNAIEKLSKMKQKALHENLSKWLCDTRINVGMATSEIAAG